MEIHVFQNQQQTGPFPVEAVVEMGRLGTLPRDALVWHDGATDWYRLEQFLRERGVPVADAPSPSRQREAALEAEALAQARRADDGPSATACVVRGVGAGFGTALVGGLLWAGGSYAVGFRIPFFGMAIGWAVGYATNRASRGEGTLLLPISACIWTLLAILPMTGIGFMGLGAFAAALWLAWRNAAD